MRLRRRLPANSPDAAWHLPLPGTAQPPPPFPPRCPKPPGRAAYRTVCNAYISECARTSPPPSARCSLFSQAPQQQASEGHAPRVAAEKRTNFRCVALSRAFDRDPTRTPWRRPGALVQIKRCPEPGVSSMACWEEPNSARRPSIGVPRRRIRWKIAPVLDASHYSMTNSRFAPLAEQHMLQEHE